MGFNFTFPPLTPILEFLAPAIISLLILFIARILIGRLITTLYNRGIIGVGTRITLFRILDTASVIIAILVIVQAYTAALTVYVVVFLIAILTVIMFFYEIRGFTAYISLQLLKYIKGRYLEIRLPNQFKPIYGRIVSMEPFSTTIEDVYGNRVFVANSLLVNAVVRETVPSIPIKITLHISGEDSLRKAIDKIIDVFKHGLVNVFRVSESQIVIEKVTKDSAIVTVNAIALSLPIRLSDITKLLDVLRGELSSYEPIIEISY